jgi:hypothetical protein
MRVHIESSISQNTRKKPVQDIFVSDRSEENSNELGFSVDKKKIFLSYLMHAKRITCLQMEIARRSFSGQPRQK